MKLSNLRETALKSILILLLFSTALSVRAYSAESSNADPYKEKVCAKYETQTGWSKGYSVTATIIKGSTLNQRTNSYDYNSYSTYAVIFWSNDQASVIELSYFSGSISAYPTSGKDQGGRKWKITNTSLCY